MMIDPAPDPRPVPKVTAAGVSGAAAVLLVYLASLVDVEVPAEAAAALATLLAFAGGYLTPPR